MLRGNKTEFELRLELLTWGAVLLAATAMWVLFNDVMPSLVVFVPGLILLGSAIFQDMQPDMKAGWLSYALAIVLVAVGLAGIINTLFGNIVTLPWLVIAVVMLGAVLVAKALYDPNLGNRPE